MPLVAAAPPPLRLEHDGRTLVLTAEAGGVRVGLGGMVLLSRVVPWEQAVELAGWLGEAIAWKEQG